MKEPDNSLVKIFQDASAHKEVADIIARHLVNREDIRVVALEGLELLNFKDILDLGCGFGFFTQGLKNKVSQDARFMGIDCHPEYEWFYFQSCEKVGPHHRKKFFSSGCDIIANMGRRSFDLILCSYALYFFPGIIVEIPRILKKDGYFVVITHALPHYYQFIDLVRKILKQYGEEVYEVTPYESLIKKFSDQNGLELLTPYFNHITEKRYKSTMVFHQEDYEDLVTYFNFKLPFFIPWTMDNKEELQHLILEAVISHLHQEKELRITKDDVIYICSDPVDHF